MSNRIYLDHNASSPLDPIVLKAVIQELQEEVGNPSSVHWHGKKSRRRLEEARQIISDYLNVKPQEIIFTSSGTEGANLALRGVFSDQKFSGHVVTCGAEHSCVYQIVKDLEKKGCQVTFLTAGSWGCVALEQLQAALRPDTKLITLMAVNNETGVKTDIEAIATVAQKAGITLIVDGVALLGKEFFTIPKGVTAMFFSGHKLHAPKGIGVLFCRQSLKLTPLFVGGEQEFNRRAGSENLSGAIGFAKAVELLKGHEEEFADHMRMLRDRLEKGLQARLDNVVVNGEGPRISNTSNLSFLGVDGESLLISLDQEGISVSHGSACSSGALEPSRVLLDMGIPLDRARSSLRFSVSRFTTIEEIDKAIDIIVKVVTRLR